MNEIPPAAVWLNENNIPFKLYVHDGPIRSIEQAAAERNQDISQVVRSILFRLNEGEYAIVLAAGKQQISWKALRTHFGMSRLTMASPEEVYKVTGYKIGTVSPFGLKTKVPMLADENVFAQPAVSMGSGVSGTAILMKRKDLKKALGEIETGRFVQYG
jgi:Cys-tRNA(Pro) deacylase